MPGEKYSVFFHPDGRHSGRLIGPRFIHVFSLVLASHKLSVHEAGGVNAVVKGKCACCISLAVAVVVVMMKGCWR